MIFPGVWHRENTDSEIGWNEHWIGFDGEVARRLFRKGFFSPKQPVIKVRQEETVLGLFATAVGAVKTNQPALQQILSGITMHILALVYSDQQSQFVGDDRGMEVTHNAMTCMRENLAARLDMGQLAGRLGVSYTLFRRNFASHTGMSPHQYLLELRLARARSLLTETNFTTKEVAHQCGFQDEHYFCRLFHKKIGTAPSKWRELARRKS